ncbi:MAG: putative hydrophobic protein (TIGR00271 family) [Verrucomicrobiales bacterium]
MGEHILQRITRKASLSDSLAIFPRVVVSDSVTEGIRSVAGEGTFDLVLIGASNVGTIRQKLFGTVPEPLLRNSGNTAVAVIREARPISQRLRERAERWLDLRIPQLTRDARIDLFEKLQDGSRWSFDFMTLICLSTEIASLGLIQNSTAVVIGAMLVAPLMIPLLGCGLAVVQGNFPLFRSASRAILYGFFCTLAIGFLMGLIAAPMTGLTSEMVSRGGPSLLDMGVAFISGVAASYCLARPKLGAALAGVAIAAALVPPIATVGISLSFGETEVARGAALLFATNVVAIVLGAAINLYAAGIRGRLKSSSQTKPLWARRAVLGLLCLCVLLAIPLGSAILSSVVEKKNRLFRRQLPQGLRPALIESLNPTADGSAVEGRVTVVGIRRGSNPDGSTILELDISAPSPPDSLQLDATAKAARDFFGEPVMIRVRTGLSQEVTAQ